MIGTPMRKRWRQISVGFLAESRFEQNYPALRGDRGDGVPGDLSWRRCLPFSC